MVRTMKANHSKIEVKSDWGDIDAKPISEAEKKKEADKSFKDAGITSVKLSAIRKIKADPIISTRLKPIPEEPSVLLDLE